MTSIDLTIGKVARAAGVGVETVRFYERKGLVQRPRKPERGFRVYSPEIVTRIRFIRAAQELGFSLREVSELLSLRADTAADAGSVRAQVGTNSATSTTAFGAFGTCVRRCGNCSKDVRTTVRSGPARFWARSISCRKRVNSAHCGQAAIPKIG